MWNDRVNLHLVFQLTKNEASIERETLKLENGYQNVLLIQAYDGKKKKRKTKSRTRVQEHCKDVCLNKTNKSFT